VVEVVDTREAVHCADQSQCLANPFHPPLGPRGQPNILFWHHRRRAWQWQFPHRGRRVVV